MYIFHTSSGLVLAVEAKSRFRYHTYEPEQTISDTYTTRYLCNRVGSRKKLRYLHDKRYARRKYGNTDHGIYTAEARAFFFLRAPSVEVVGLNTFSRKGGGSRAMSPPL